MHHNEFKIDIELVYSLIKSQCPQWAELPIQVIRSSGTDNALFRLGDNYVVRLPRLEGADFNINKECEWLPKIAQSVTVNISCPLYKGYPNQSYPSLWSVIKWNTGENPTLEKGREYESIAKELAEFINQLQTMPIDNAPLSRRGVPLVNQDEEIRHAIRELKKEVDTNLMYALWDELSNTPTWQHQKVWIHGDLLPGNILIQNNQLSAVIDFSDVGIGDPACDLIPAWCLFGPHSRKIFRQNLNNIDDNTWKRGKGWALSIALIIIPYYKNTNPALTAVAWNMINNILDDRGQ